MKDGWDLKPLGEACTVVNGGTPKTGVSAYWDGQHQWITPAEMGRRASPFVTSTTRTLSDQGLANSSATLIPAGSVILSTRAPIGHLVINEVPMAFNQGCRGLVPGPGLSPRYLFHYLDHSRELLDSMGTGATFKELSAGRLKEVRIPVPSLAEQERIVRILDEALDGIATAQANTESSATRVRDILSVRLDEEFERVAAASPEVVLEDLAVERRGSIRTGPFGSQLLHSEFVSSGIAVLGIDNAVANEFRWGAPRFITEEKYRELTRYTAYPGDVVITIMGTIGRCAVVPDDIPTSITSKHLFCVSLDTSRCLPEYLHAHFLYSPEARRYLGRTSKGSIMDGLNMAILRAIPIALPPLDKQQAVVELAASVKASVSAYVAVGSEKLGRLDHLRASLLGSAFAGKL